MNLSRNFCRLFIPGFLIASPTMLFGNPSGGSISAGSATISGQGTANLQIKQTSNAAIINWNSYSISKGEQTQYLMPSSQSAVLNRVVSGGISTINGTLKANGQVYLINQNGIVVGPSGVINTAGFTGSTRDIADSDFLNGKLHFVGKGTGQVVNQGMINAGLGNVALIGKQVSNSGTITAPNGTAGLVAGDDVLLAQQNADGSTITVNPSPLSTPFSIKTKSTIGVNNSGSILAKAAELNAANGNIYSLVINNSGAIRATTSRRQGGHIWLTSDTGAITNSGIIDASATSTNGLGGSVAITSASGYVNNGRSGQILAKGAIKGGKVTLTAPDITLSQLSLIDVSSSAGQGGSVQTAVTDELVGTVKSAINASGYLQGGTIANELSNTADLLFSGSMDVSSSAGKGGTIQATNGYLILAGANLNAQGYLGGGHVFLGGGPKGTLLEGMLSSRYTYVGTGTSIKADATGKGNGGQAVVTSTGNTEFDGTITATGGSQGGDGGEVEISGQTGFTLTGKVDTKSTLGKAGDLLLDPHNLTISSTATSSTSALQATLMEAVLSATSDAAPNDQFGVSVSLYGNEELIGALGKNNDQGAAYLFSNGTIVTKYSDLLGINGDAFGASVALTGTNALIGAYGTNNSQGAAYLYNLSSSAPVETYTDPTGGTNQFGISLALTGNLGLIGSQGAAYLYNLSGGTLLLTYNDPGGTASDSFGTSVALTANNALIAAEGTNNDKGAVYLYNLSSSAPVVNYNDPVGFGSDYFGNSVALSGRNALIGAYGTNTASGVAYLYNLSSSTPLLTYNDPGGVRGDSFGKSVALTDTNALIGAVQTNGLEGAAYLYNLSISTPIQTYSDPGGTASDYFGYTVALTANKALISAVGNDSFTGAAYLYSITNTSLVGYGASPAQDATISVSNLENLLASSSVTLQANTDLTLAASSDIVSTSTNSLTLQAGRSVYLNSNINTNGGNLTVIANDGSASASYRDPGAAQITALSGTTINAGTGNVSITMGTGSTPGPINLESVSAGNLTINSSSGMAVTANGTISVGSFILQNGNWTQNANGGTLPTLTANSDFELQNSSSFLRVAGGNGSTGNPYQIMDVYGLQGIGSPSGSLLGNSFTMGANIDASGTATWNGGVGLIPIGNRNRNGNNISPYTGTFDGSGYTINGLTIHQPSLALAGVGLFGYTADSSIIKNVRLSAVSVTGSDEVGGLIGLDAGLMVQSCSVSGSVSGAYFVGGLVGVNDGTVRTSNATCSVTGSEGSVGGLVGFNYGSIETCFATGAVTGNSNIGGLVGVSYGMIETSYAIGMVNAITQEAGGLVGGNNGPIETCYATGAVNSAIYVGGLVSYNSGTVETCYATGPVTGTSNVGGLVGYNTSGGNVVTSYWETDALGQGATTSIGLNSGAIDGFTCGQTLAQLKLQSTFQPTGTGVPNWDFINTWTTNGDTTPPQFIPPSSLSGSAVTGNDTIDLIVSGAILSTTTANASGFYTFTVPAADYTSGLLITDVSDNTADTYYIASNPPTSVTGVNLDADTLTVLGSGIASNTALGTAAGSLTGTGINYSVASSDLTTNSGVGITIDASYTLDGNITANGALKLTSTAALSGSGNVTLSANGMSLAGSLTVPATVTLNSSGTISATGPVQVGGFILQSGDWAQNANGGTLPTFIASNDFELQNSSSFLRVAGGDGSVGNPYQIIDVYGLQGIGSPSNAHLGDSFVLSDNIDASGTATWNPSSTNGTTTYAGFVPIGGSFSTSFPPPNQYAGTFNGAGKTISGLTIDRSAQNNIGLFGATSPGSVIEQLGLRGESVIGGETVGGLVGYNSGTVETSYTTGEVSGVNTVGGLVGFNYSNNSSNSGTVEMCYTTGVVIGGDYAGGLVGFNEAGILELSYATGMVSGTYYVGGLVGYNHNNPMSNIGTVEMSYATGSVSGIYRVGGLVGINSGLVETSYATGAIRGVSSFGGLVGSNYGTVEASYRATDASNQQANSSSGYPEGSIDGYTSGVTLEQLQQQSTFKTAGTGLSNWDFTLGTGVWGINGYTSTGLINNGLPYFQWQYPTQAQIVPHSQTLTYSRTKGSLSQSLGTAYSVNYAGTYAGDLTSLLSSEPIFTVQGANVNVVNSVANTVGVVLSVTPGVAVEVANNGATVTYSPLSINTVNLTGSVSKTYDATATVDPTDAGYSSLVLSSGDILPVDVSMLKIVAINYSYGGNDMGTWDVTAKGLSLNGNSYGDYTLGPTTAIAPNAGKIGPATLTYVANPLETTVGFVLPPLTGTVTGFQSLETLANATTGTLMFSTLATSGTAGAYAIEGSGLSANNYIFVQAPGNATALTINTPATAPTINDCGSLSAPNDISQQALGEIPSQFNNNPLGPIIPSVDSQTGDKWYLYERPTWLFPDSFTENNDMWMADSITGIIDDGIRVRGHHRGKASTGSENPPTLHR